MSLFRAAIHRAGMSPFTASPHVCLTGNLAKQKLCRPEEKGDLTMITADCHLHSSFSGDSQSPMEEMILQAIRKGLETLCFTEHNDFDYPEYPDLAKDYFLLDTDSYLRELSGLREKYAGKIRLLFGAELGLQPQAVSANAAYAKAYEFDFLIGSTHICHGKDPYYPGFFEGRNTASALGEYFEATLENIRGFSDYDVCGHLDYAVRYAPEQQREYAWETYKDILDAILKHLTETGKGIELNTGGIKSGMRDFHPCAAVLKRYRELGGEIVTIGSDAHAPEHIASHFDRAAETLKACGFRYYCVFEKRIPGFYRL